MQVAVARDTGETSVLLVLLSLEDSIGRVAVWLLKAFCSCQVNGWEDVERKWQGMEQECEKKKRRHYG